MLAHSCSAASVYSGYEVDDDWCVSVLQSYQAEREVVFPWSVGKVSSDLITEQVQSTYAYLSLISFFFVFCFYTWSHPLLMLPGEDMTLEGRRQLALFLVRLSHSVLSGLKQSHLLPLSHLSIHVKSRRIKKSSIRWTAFE